MMVKIGQPSMAKRSVAKRSDAGMWYPILDEKNDSTRSPDPFEEYFNGDWRLGQEVHKLVITQRLYQTSPNSTQD